VVLFFGGAQLVEKSREQKNEHDGPGSDDDEKTPAITGATVAMCSSRKFFSAEARQRGSTCYEAKGKPPARGVLTVKIGW